MAIFLISRLHRANSFSLRPLLLLDLKTQSITTHGYDKCGKQEATYKEYRPISAQQVIVYCLAVHLPHFRQRERESKRETHIHSPNNPGQM